MDLVKNAGETGAYFRAELPRPSAATGMSARCAATAMLAAVELVADRDDRVFFDASQKIGSQVSAALAERGRHRPRHAAGRYPRFRAAALPDARGSRQVVAKTADAVKSVFATR
ncbi:hypothetical protein AJ88_24160 [Mesorhizobium amorphae CCBAU 01583]|nr:hypothetical protein AJ88_24160 [Mesorhizobium amorphae CCBAU 01583]